MPGADQRSLGNRKAFVRRAGIFVLALALSVISFILVLFAGAGSRRAFQEQSRFSAQNMQLWRLVSDVRSECRVALADVGSADADAVKARVGELADEAEEAGTALADTCRALGLSGHVHALEDELDEMVQAVRDSVAASGLGRTDVARAAETAATLDELLEEVAVQAEATASQKARKAGLLMSVGAALLAVSLAVGLGGALLAVSDVINVALGPSDLGQEMRTVEADGVFQGRMGLLAAHGPDAKEGEPWRLTLVSELHGRETHLTFKAEARRGDDAVLLWGKRYRWAGLVKGFQKMLWPSYGLGTWNALRRMRAHGLPAPVPVAAVGIRKGPFLVGRVVLAEHVGRTESVKRFVRGRLDGMAAAERREFLSHLLSFWKSLHDCGLYGLSLRYLHMLPLDDGARQRPTFYLFDLDKVWVKAVGNNWSNWLLRVLDDGRLRRWLEGELIPEEMDLVRQQLCAGRGR